MAELDDGWDKILRCKEGRRRGFRRFVQRLWNTSYLFLRLGRSKGKVFLGDPYLNWFRYLGNIYGDEVVWLDDGAASINVINKFIDKNLLDGPNATTPKFFTVFSSPSLEKQTNGAIMQNNLEVKQTIRRETQKIRPKSAIFVGQWLSERGGVNQDQELQTLFELTRDFNDWDLTYVCHRHESIEKLERISKKFQIERYESSIETILLQAEELPEVVISWYSTALFTLRLIFPEIKFVSIQVPLACATDEQRQEWMRVYSALDRVGVDVLGYDRDWSIH